MRNTLNRIYNEILESALSRYNDSRLTGSYSDIKLKLTKTQNEHKVIRFGNESEFIDMTISYENLKSSEMPKLHGVPYVMVKMSVYKNSNFLGGLKDYFVREDDIKMLLVMAYNDVVFDDVFIGCK